MENIIEYVSIIIICYLVFIYKRSKLQNNRYRLERENDPLAIESKKLIELAKIEKKKFAIELDFKNKEAQRLHELNPLIMETRVKLAEIERNSFTPIDIKTTCPVCGNSLTENEYGEDEKVYRECSNDSSHYSKYLGMRDDINE